MCPEWSKVPTSLNSFSYILRLGISHRRIIQLIDFGNLTLILKFGNSCLILQVIFLKISKVYNLLQNPNNFLKSFFKQVRTELVLAVYLVNYYSTIAVLWSPIIYFDLSVFFCVQNWNCVMREKFVKTNIVIMSMAKVLS